jgi:hypothetical protein
MALDMALMGNHFMGMALIDMHLMGIYLMGMHLKGMHLMRFWGIWEVALFVNLPHRT